MSDHKPYVVTWTIEIEATSPEVAAQMARDIQLDPDSIATVFEVRKDLGFFPKTVVVDLEATDERQN